MRYIISLILLLAFFNIHAQKSNDAILLDTFTHKEYLPSITVVGTDTRTTTYQLPEIVGTHIYAGKKNALVVVNNINGNIATNTMRQILAKVPGIHIWESDGSGLQIGIATRGLSANRSWDFNVRQNGFDISADPFGYPEAYYNPPMQAVQRLQIVKGAGSLQFGPQIGGMLNYVLKDGSDINKPFSIESQQTAGSFGLLNTYNAIGGTHKKSNYYAFFDHRAADGYRTNSAYKANTGYGTYNYQVNSKLKMGVELLKYYMLSQQPGGLTDAQLAVDSKQSFRARNWMNIDWTTASSTIDYKLNENNIFNLKIFYLQGDRNSIGFINPINILDTINKTTNDYNHRTIDIDRYRNAGAELRYLTNYYIGNVSNSLTASVRYFNGKTHRLRNGKGSTGFDYNIHNLNTTYPGDLNFTTTNIAASVENVIRLKKLLIIPGIRWETLTATGSGRIGMNANGTENLMNAENRKRSFILFGLATEYHLKTGEIYGNITQSYRPIQFADLAVSATTDVVDANLKDSRSYSIDLGYRAKIKNHFNFDVNLYYLNYGNRIGTIVQLRPDLTSYNLRTNVGTSISKGIEALVEFNFMQAGLLGKKYGEIALFTTYSYNSSLYDDFIVITKNADNTLKETNLKNKKVENAPDHILRGGLTYLYKSFSLTTQLSYVSSTFTDATNIIQPNAAATVGLIPAYTIIDIAASYRYKKYNVKAGLNNLTNAVYFTRRAGGFPGPGLMPSDARNFFISVGVKL
jgi:Fe(3+) dicitrate transport protein